MIKCAKVPVKFSNRSHYSVAESLADMTLIQPPVACGTASHAANPIHYPIPDAPLFAHSFTVYRAHFRLLSLTVRCGLVVLCRHATVIKFVCMCMARYGLFVLKVLLNPIQPTNRMYVCMSILNHSLVV